MDWARAIEINREGLRRILALLVTMARDTAPAHQWATGPLAPSPSAAAPARQGLTAATLPRRLHRAVLRLLRPAESAARRLVIIVAKDIVVAPPPHRPQPPPKRGSIVVKSGAGIILPRGMRVPDTGQRRTRTSLTLPLFDSPRRIGQIRRPPGRAVPRISSFAPGAPRPFAIRPPPSPDDELDTTRISLRFAALAATLDDLPRAAMRFARWRVRRDAALAADKAARASGIENPARRTRLWPLRAGRPPGSLRRPVHEVHKLLKETHGLAVWVMEGSDTS
jgi:hypothetical protein